MVQINANSSSYDLIPEGQLGLSENELPQSVPNLSPLVVVELTHDLLRQTLELGGYAAADVNAGKGTVFNGGVARKNEKWRDALIRELANRYVSAAFCSWCVCNNVEHKGYKADYMRSFCAGILLVVLSQAC